MNIVAFDVVEYEITPGHHDNSSRDTHVGRRWYSNKSQLFMTSNPFLTGSPLSFWAAKELF